jgi:hypothetical protein
VQLGKLVLLSEKPVDGETVGAGQLSRLMSDVLGQPYDWSLLNLNGQHGGNIFTTTLPKPGQTMEFDADIGASGLVPVDSRPWLRLIDGGSWRDDIATPPPISSASPPPWSKAPALPKRFGPPGFPPIRTFGFWFRGWPM